MSGLTLAEREELAFKRANQCKVPRHYPYTFYSCCAILGLMIWLGMPGFIWGSAIALGASAIGWLCSLGHHYG